MITYKWSIEKVIVTTNDAVTHVHWRCEGTDDVNELTAACAGVRELILGDSFIPYLDLTEQQVLDWCYATETIEIKDVEGNLVETIIKHLKDDSEGQVAGQIANQILKKQAEPALPWTQEQL